MSILTLTLSVGGEHLSATEYCQATTLYGWFHEHLSCECSLTHYTLTLEVSQRLKLVPSSAVDL